MKTRIPFQFEDDVVYGELQEVTPLIRRIMAPNPSLFTYKGTGTYVVGRGNVAVIDPGPNLAQHISAITESLRHETISHIVVTHTHSDHSSAAMPLKEICGAPIYGRTLHEYSDDEEQFEEEYDRKFRTSVEVSDGDVIEGEGWTLQCVHTPGHMSNHICYRLRQERSLFCGDHVMGWSTTVIIPPDGSMKDYLESLEKLLTADDEIYYPTHGPPIRRPQSFVRACIEHRHQRELEVIQSLRSGNHTVREMVADVYREVDNSLHPAASRSLLATLIKLWQDGRIACSDAPDLASSYRLLE